jgi:hypothetical protein
VHQRRWILKKRQVLWLPTLIVLTASLFHVETVAVITHLLHPDAGRLGAYRISIPLLWHIDFPWHWSGDSKLIQAYRTRGITSHGLLFYVRHQPRFSSIEIANTNAQDHLFFREGDKDWDCRLLENAEMKINCCVDPFNKKYVHVKCWTVNDEVNQSLEAIFYGSERNASVLYTAPNGTQDALMLSAGCSSIYTVPSACRTTLSSFRRKTALPR